MDHDDILRPDRELSLPVHHRPQRSSEHRVPVRNNRLWQSELRVSAGPLIPPDLLTRVGFCA